MTGSALLPLSFGVELEFLSAIKVPLEGELSGLNTKNPRRTVQSVRKKLFSADNNEQLTQAAYLLETSGCPVDSFNDSQLVRDPLQHSHWSLSDDHTVKASEPQNVELAGVFENDITPYRPSNRWLTKGLKLVSRTLPASLADDSEAISIESLNELHKYVATLQSFRNPQFGTYENNTCAIHVHVGTDFIKKDIQSSMLPLDLLQYLAYLIVQFEPLITLLRPKRRNGFDSPAGDGFVNWTRLIDPDTEDSQRTIEFYLHINTLNADQVVQWTKFCIALVKAAERKKRQTKEGTPITAVFPGLLDSPWTLSKLESDRAGVEVMKYRPGARTGSAGFRELFDLLQPELGIEEEKYWMGQFEKYHADDFRKEKEVWTNALGHEPGVKRLEYYKRIGKVWGIDNQGAVETSTNDEDPNSIKRPLRTKPLVGMSQTSDATLKREDSFYAGREKPPPFWEEVMSQDLREIEDIIDWGIEDDDPEIIWRMSAFKEEKKGVSG